MAAHCRWRTVSRSAATLPTQCRRASLAVFLAGPRHEARTAKRRTTFVRNIFIGEVVVILPSKGAPYLLCLFAIVIGWAPPVLAQQRSIEVSWVEVHDEISPRQVVSRKSRSLRFNLEDDITIITSARTYRADSEQITRNGTGLTRWRVEGPNTLVREQLNPGYIRRVTIQINGGSKCHASISFSPRSGTLYQMNRNLDGTGEVLFLRSVSAENVTCRTVGHAGV